MGPSLIDNRQSTRGNPERPVVTVDPTSPIADNTVMRRRVTVSPILVAICLATRPGAAGDGAVYVG